MIVDKLSNSLRYSGLGERINEAFNYLTITNFVRIQPGKYEINGDNIFAIVAEYQTKDRSEGVPESHKKYIDVQYVSDGCEIMGYAPLVNQEVIERYSDENDIVFYKADCSFFKVNKGMFAIFFPEDVHLPGIMVDEKSFVKKVVVKVKI